MANEEIRGEQQDPRLIGISVAGGPAQAGVVSGLGGQAGSVPGMPGLSPIPVPYPDAVTRVFDTLPIYGKRFFYDTTVALSVTPFGAVRELGTLTALIPLLGYQLPQPSTIFTVGAPPLLIPGAATGFASPSNYVPLVTGFFAQVYATGLPVAPVHSPIDKSEIRLQVSGLTAFEYVFNGFSTDDIQKVFVPLDVSDVLSVAFTIDFDHSLPTIIPADYTLWARIQLAGAYLPNRGLPKEVTVS